MAAAPPEYICTLSKELQEKARRELNETAETRKDGLKKLFEMIQARPHMNCPTDAVFLLGFLRARKFDIDRSFKLLENWCRVRVEMKEVFSDYRPSTAKELIQDGVFFSLSTRDSEGRLISISRPGKWNPKNSTVWELMKVSVMAGDINMMDEETQINGVVLILDMGGIGMRHITQFGPRLAMKVAPLMSSDTFPQRVGSINVLNESGFFDGMYAILKPFLKEKIRKRFFIHGDDLSKLHSKVSSSLLPGEYGGSVEKSLDDFANRWADLLHSKEDMFAAMMDYGLKKTKNKYVNSEESVARVNGI
ncbi:alpha-tocopherol transfer protein-like [Saccoglossus kowalevskii]|uniref:Alpha-tocopherol transfer protein-like n=1 Tax=Saccoglossus kowalevskii TaxID=10224 RepID=A0ABM0GRJ5_SACKO|nr:PREDICTED: alpha-tocopherol transfer protein-like [Saccoglossus kowalevskii]